ncbi:MAG: type I-E CRISPR-associated protein Cas6/Cse3/CasE [Planctomycetia bacterium]|nr:type I-E CRISPR-associated protein Cas6/Cse3/CasE [Planctomycetia bacterium]
MNYFTRIELDERHPGAREALGHAFGSARSDHQFLWRFFPAADGSARDFLFRRFDPEGERQQALFYCVSQRPAVAPHPAWQVQSREYAPQVGTGDRLRFDLRVNPTQARERDGKSRRDDVVMHAKKRIMAEHGATRWADVPEAGRPPLYELTHKSIRDWLGDSSRPGIAIRNGFRVLDDLRVDSYLQHRIPRGGQREITLSTVDLSGTLEVDDPTAFASALLGGIGHAKAFGCGLLLVRRP